MAKNYILALGNPVYDIISTPVLQSSERILSGCSTNACLAASKLGYGSLLIGRSGEDYKDTLQRDLEKRNIDSIIYESRQTGGFSLIYDDSGNRELSVLGIAEPLPEVIPDLPEPDFILLGPILGEISATLTKCVFDKFSSVPILLDPQGLLRTIEEGQIVHKHTDEFDKIVPFSTIVKANELETFTVTGIDPRKEPREAVRALYSYGPQRAAIVTLAEAGSIIFDGAGYYEVPPYTTSALDPTGAGDTYAAGFMVKYLETPDDLAATGCFASSVASVMVENSGPDFPLTREEADRRFHLLFNSAHKLRL